MCEHNFSISKLWLLQHKLITLKLNERSLFCAPIKYRDFCEFICRSFWTSLYYGMLTHQLQPGYFNMQNNICYLSRVVIVFANDLFIYYMPKTVIKYMCHVALCFFIGTHFLCQKAQMSKTLFSLSFTILYTEVLDYVRVLSTKKFC